MKDDSYVVDSECHKWYTEEDACVKVIISEVADIGKMVKGEKE